MDEAAERLQDTKRKIDQLLQADRASAQEIEQIVQGNLAAWLLVKPATNVVLYNRPQDC